MKNFKRDFDVLRRLFHSRLIYYQARRQGLIGAKFYPFGQALAWRAWWAQRKMKPTILYTPVSITRYYEFDFVERMLRRMTLPLEKGLDLSSPFLFSFYAGSHGLADTIYVCNPDASDLKDSRFYADKLPGESLRFVEGTEEALRGEEAEGFDAVWSISVVEHILTETGDERDTLRRLWGMLRPGGVLVLTVPVDVEAWDEYRDRDNYGTQLVTDWGYFFQRFYDEASVRGRLVEAVGVEPEVVEWFGEREKGHFHAYIRRWMEEGAGVTVEDPLDMARNYQRYESFEAMPGAGVCGLCFRKPESGTEQPK